MLRSGKSPAFSLTALFVFASLIAALFAFLYGPAPACAGPVTSPRLQRVMQRVLPGLRAELQRKGLEPGAPVYLRIFKLSGELELWVFDRDRYQLFKRYPICASSGFPGPKLKEGDWQSPEGSYTVTAKRMNPNSRYHLSFDLGFPNEYDRSRGRSRQLTDGAWGMLPPMGWLCHDPTGGIRGDLSPGNLWA